MLVDHELWSAWSCRCGAAGVHPADSPNARRRFHDSARAGHGIVRVLPFDQAVMVEPDDGRSAWST